MKAACIIVLLLMACESQGPRPDVESDDRDGGPAETLDMDTVRDMGAITDMNTDGGQLDSTVLDGEVTTSDLGLMDQWVSEPQPSPEVACNGIDDDDDGLLDEGIANVCGGCEEIPPEGCQSWQVNTIGQSEGRIFPDRVVGLAAHVLKDEIFDVDNASCSLRIYRSPPDPDAHLGDVSLETDQFELSLSPMFDEVRRSIVYAPDGSIDPVQLEFEDPTLSVQGSGGALVGPFESEMEMRAPLRGVSEEALATIVSASRAEAIEGSTSLHWLPDDGPINLYVGGSIPLFQNGRNYRGIEHYILRARLEDDGVFRVPVEIFDGGIEDSSVWVHVMRDQHQTIPIGPHAVRIMAGRRIEARGAGRQEADLPPPFQILSPSPNAPMVEAEQPVEVRWSALPEGSGPLTATFSIRMEESGEHHQMVCTIVDPELGSFTLPGERTASWHVEAGDFHQLTLNWILDRRYFEGADSGSWHRSQAVLLRLDR